MEKKLNLQRLSILFGFCVLIATTFSCQSESNKSSSDRGNKGLLEQRTEVIQNPSAKKEGFQNIARGDSILHRIHINGKLQYESLTLEGKRVYNYFYPQISDSFLFEDKYYLKISYPISFSGTIQITIPECPDYVLTPLNNGILQVVIYNALDLSAVALNFHYSPSEKDSLVSSEYFFNHVIYH